MHKQGGFYWHFFRNTFLGETKPKTNNSDWPLPKTLQKLEYNIADQDKCLKYWEEDYKLNDNYGAVDYEFNMDDLAG